MSSEALRIDCVICGQRFKGHTRHSRYESHLAECKLACPSTGKSGQLALDRVPSEGLQYSCPFCTATFTGAGSLVRYRKHVDSICGSRETPAVRPATSAAAPAAVRDVPLQEMRSMISGRLWTITYGTSAGTKGSPSTARRVETFRVDPVTFMGRWTSQKDGEVEVVYSNLEVNVEDSGALYLRVGAPPGPCYTVFLTPVVKADGHIDSSRISMAYRRGKAVSPGFRRDSCKPMQHLPERLVNIKSFNR